MSDERDEATEGYADSDDITEEEAQEALREKAMEFDGTPAAEDEDQESEPGVAAGAKPPAAEIPLDEAIRREAAVQTAGLRQEIVSLRAENRKYAERVEAILNALAQANADDEQENEPSWADDPGGFTERTVARAVEPLYAEAEDRKVNDEQKQKAETYAKIIHWAVDDRKKAIEGKPDYEAAEEWLHDRLFEDWKEANPEVPDDVLERHLQMSMGDAARIADYRAGRSWAERIYGMAQRRGWKPEMAGDGANQGGSKSASRTAQARPKKKAQQAPRRAPASLGEASRSVRPAGDVAKLIKEMDDDDFADFVDSLGKTPYDQEKKLKGILEDQLNPQYLP